MRTVYGWLSGGPKRPFISLLLADAALFRFGRGAYVCVMSRRLRVCECIGAVRRRPRRVREFYTRENVGLTLRVVVNPSFFLSLVTGRDIMYSGGEEC